MTFMQLLQPTLPLNNFCAERNNQRRMYERFVRKGEVGQDRAGFFYFALWSHPNNIHCCYSLSTTFADEHGYQMQKNSKRKCYLFMQIYLKHKQITSVEEKERAREGNAYAVVIFIRLH